MKWLFPLLFLILSGCEQKGFSIQKITSRHPRQLEWATTALPREPLEPILNQPFFYMASGYQSYSFVSEDGRYVLKFFKQNHMRLDFFERYAPWLSRINSQRKRKYDKRRAVRRAMYGSCKIAFEELAEDTQLIYIHLTKGDDLKREVCITDSRGKKHTLALDDMEFVIQRKGELCVDRLQKLVNDCCIEEAEALIEKVLILVQRRNAKGIIDGDMVFEQNYGVMGDTPFLIDIGSLKRGDGCNESQEMKQRIKECLARFYCKM